MALRYSWKWSESRETRESCRAWRSVAFLAGGRVRSWRVSSSLRLLRDGVAVTSLAASCEDEDDDVELGGALEKESKEKPWGGGESDA
jgi:hypothetical protein